jgi:serine/threonine protein kinase
MIDQVIDKKYHILRKIGEGGMGSVFLARDMVLDREVALKIINPNLANDTKLLSRFKVEAIAQAKFNHPNIVVLYDFSQSGNIFYIVMEYIKGKSLRQILREEGALPIQRVINIFRQILSAISYAHKFKVIHRDLKPENILLTEDDTVKISDFGIAKVFGVEGLTSAGAVIGTPWYSAPEQILGKKIDERTDLYSLGVTLFEMLTGKVPFESTTGSQYEIIRAHIEKSPPSLRSINPSIPVELEKIVFKALEKNPEKRFKNADEFLSAIQEFVESLKKKTGVKSKTALEEVKSETIFEGIKKKLPQIEMPSFLSFFKQRAGLILGFVPFLSRKLAFLVNILILLFLVFIISILFTPKKGIETVVERAPIDFSSKIAPPPSIPPMLPPQAKKHEKRPAEREKAKIETGRITSIPIEAFFKKDISYIEKVKEKLEAQIKDNPSDGESLALLGRIELEFYSNYSEALEYLGKAINLGFPISLTVYHMHKESIKECYGILTMNKKGDISYSSLTFPEHNFRTSDVEKLSMNFLYSLKTIPDSFKESTYEYFSFFRHGFNIVFLKDGKKVKYEFLSLSMAKEDAKFIVDLWKKHIK